MDRQIRLKLNMSTNKGAFECACRVPGMRGSRPSPTCADCDGTGYTNNVEHKKDWIRNPPSYTDE